MKYKVKIHSTPIYKAIITARNIEEAKRIARQNANLMKIRVLYSDEIEVMEIDFTNH